LAAVVAPVLTVDEYTCNVVAIELITLVVETNEKRNFCM
jgi:hypothetical protein